MVQRFFPGSCFVLIGSLATQSPESKRTSEAPPPHVYSDEGLKPFAGTSAASESRESRESASSISGGSVIYIYSIYTVYVLYARCSTLRSDPLGMIR